MNFSWQWNWENLNTSIMMVLSSFMQRKILHVSLNFNFTYSEDIELMKVKQTWTSSLTLSKSEKYNIPLWLYIPSCVILLLIRTQLTPRYWLYIMRNFVSQIPELWQLHSWPKKLWLERLQVPTKEQQFQMPVADWLHTIHFWQFP